MSANLQAVAARIARKLDEVSITEDIAPHDAWPRVAAEMLGYGVDSLEFFSNRDSGIDFCSRADRTFEVFQCKMHELKDSGDPNVDASFGPDGYIDLNKAADFLFLRSSPPNVDARLISFREQLQEEIGLSASDTADDEPAPVTLVFHLVILGDSLTPAAKAAGKTFRARLRELSTGIPALKVVLEHSGLSTLADFFESDEVAPRQASPIRLRLAYDKLKFKQPADAEIRSSNFVTFYVPATDLVAAARKEGVALFDANVRYELSSSNINEQIRTSARHPKTMKYFHLYNNGVTITSRGWAYKDSQKAIEINQPAIINGCQTVRSLYKVQKELEEEEEGRLLDGFKETCLVLVRLINRDIVNPDELVRAANTQNAMEPRNLLANRTEQRALEKELQDYGWFYERKDGALDALREAKRSSLGANLSVFQVKREGKGGRKAIRSSDNREVARRWLSFIGYADQGKNQRRQHFPADGKGLYPTIFQSIASHHRLVAELGGFEVRLEVGRPPAGWMLYAHHVYSLVKHLLPVATRLRSKVRRELQSATGKEPSLAAINERILSDDTHRLSFALSMLDHVTVALVGFAFARALGEKWLSAGAVSRALDTGAISEITQFAEIPAKLPQEGVLGLQEAQLKGDPALIAIRLAVQAVDATLRRPEFLLSFRSSERKSRYIESETLVRAYAEMLDNYDKYLSGPDFAPWWKSGSPLQAIRKLLS